MTPQLDAVATRLREALGDTLLGIYVHGSFALGCFNPRCSDLDLLVVTRPPLDPAQRATLAELPMGSYDAPGWPRPLELSVLVEEQLRPWRHPAPYDFHLSSKGVSGPGFDPDLAAHVTVARRAGIPLVGPPPTELLPEVPRADYVDSLLRDADWCLEERTPSRHAILSLARIWATLAEPDVLHSKVSGAEWAVARLPGPRRDTLGRALESYRTDGRETDVDAAAFASYAEDLAARIESLRP